MSRGQCLICDEPGCRELAQDNVAAQIQGWFKGRGLEPDYCPVHHPRLKSQRATRDILIDMADARNRMTSLIDEMSKTLD